MRQLIDGGDRSGDDPPCVGNVYSVEGHPRHPPPALLLGDHPVLNRVYHYEQKVRKYVALLHPCHICLSLQLGTNYHLTHPLVATSQVLDFSFCVLEPGSASFADVNDGAQVTLASMMFLLVITRFIWDSFQMYKVTRRWQPGRYMNLFAREGVLYFLAYVYISSRLSQPVPVDGTHARLPALQYPPVRTRQCPVSQRQTPCSGMASTTATGLGIRARVHARAAVHFERAGVAHVRASRWAAGYRQRVWFFVGDWARCRCRCH